MRDTFIFDFIKLRLKKHRVHFRKPLPLKKYEKAILGIIASKEGEVSYTELGKILGFAIEDDQLSNIRKDKAEIEIFEAYLYDLKRSHLLDYDSEFITLSDWGFRALEEDRKFGFYRGYVQIPEFFDIQCTDTFIIPSWRIGLPAIISDSNQVNSIWPSKSNDDTLSNELQFFRENYKVDEEIFIDDIEESSDYSTRSIELKFAIDIDQLIVFYANERIDFLESLLNAQENSAKKEELRKRIELKNYIERSPEIVVESLEQYLGLIDWQIIFSSGKFKWHEPSIFKLADWDVSWLDITENCPIDVLFNSIEKFKSEVDWSVLTQRCENTFIFSLLDKFDWDLEILLSRISVLEFRDHFEKLILFDGIDLETFYIELDEEFIIQNIEKLPGIADFVMTQRQEFLAKIIPDYVHLDWNWNRFSTTVPLPFILDKVKVIAAFLDIDIILMRVYTEADSITDDTLEYLLKHVSEDFGYLLNAQTKLKLTLSQIELLDRENKIYWGNEKVKGFEVNANQEWTSVLVNRFIDKWSYPSGEEFISTNLRDMTVLMNLPLNWTFDSFSSNKYLCDQPTFLKENASLLNWEKVIPVLTNKSLTSSFEFIEISEGLTPEKLAEILSKRLSFSEMIDLSDRFLKKFTPLLPFLNWRQMIDVCSNETLQNFVLNKKESFNFFSQNDHFSKAISSKIQLDVILELEDLNWDWPIVTRQAIKQEMIDEQIIYDYAHLWDWKTLIENVYEPEQLLLENDLPEIATLISMSIDEENSNRAWRYITSIYPIHLIWNAINVTSNIELIKWDWDYLSSSTRMPVSINTLEQYADKINWEVFSGNNFLNKLFRNDKELFSSRQTWETHVLKYLDRFKDKWHFDRLSLIQNINGNARIISQYKDRWDWKILSSDQSTLLTRGIKKNRNYNSEMINLFLDKIDFDVLSSRSDCIIDLNLIQKFSHAKWNWNLLSFNSSLVLDTELFLENFVNKDWDWMEISKNQSFQFNNDVLSKLRDKDLDWAFFSSANWLDSKTILHLKDRSWNWISISKNQGITFNADLLNILADKKEIHWKSILRSENVILDKVSLGILSSLFVNGSEQWQLITRNKVLDINDYELINAYRDYWDWDFLITEFKLDFNSIDVLEAFSNKINWLSLSQHDKFIPTFSILSIYSNQLNWYYITPKLDFSNEDFINRLVEEFGSFIDWTHVCSTANFKGGLAFVEKNYSILDHYALMNNPSIDVEIYNFIKAKIDKDIHSKFIYRLKDQNSPWSGFVYHFTHLTNAIEIIKNKKILSRNLAQSGASKFSDAAGSVVHRRDTAHEYARFYFRPKTLTQFYNECLGKDINDEKYYTKANGLGLPKCPIPIFFKFDLEEIFSVMRDKCLVSNGNLQANNSKIGTIKEMYNKFNFEHVYGTLNSSGLNDYRKWSQQEFLVQDFFDFSKLKKYEILVMNESDLAQLHQIFKNNKEILSKTRVARYDDEIYMSSNKKINYSLKGNLLKVSTDYEGNGVSKGMFTLNLDSKNYNIRKGTPQYASADSLSFYPSIEIEFEDRICFNLIFKDFVTKKDPWEIIKYCNVD